MVEVRDVMYEGGDQDLTCKLLPIAASCRQTNMMWLEY